LVVVILSIFFVKFAFKEKSRLINISDRDAHFIKIIEKENLESIPDLTLNNTFYYFMASYLGRITGIKNYLNHDSYAVKQLETGKNLYYINTVFQDVSHSYFNNPEKFNYKIVFNDTKYNFNIYQIDLKR